MYLEAGGSMVERQGRSEGEQTEQEQGSGCGRIPHRSSELIERWLRDGVDAGDTTLGEDLLYELSPGDSKRGVFTPIDAEQFCEALRLLVRHDSIRDEDLLAICQLPGEAVEYYADRPEVGLDTAEKAVAGYVRVALLAGHLRVAGGEDGSGSR